MPPPLSSHRGRPSAWRAADQTQRSSSSHAQYVLTVTAAPASRVEAAVSKRPGHLLTVKVVSESRMTLATSVPILVFPGLFVLELGPMYTTVRPGDLDLRPFDLESGVRVTCDVGYLCTNFGLPRPLCSRVIHDVRDRQTDVRQKHRLMPPAY